MVTRSEQSLVLVVDPSEAERYIIGRYLEHLGYRPAFARDGIEAVRMADDLRPVAVLLDLLKPSVCGEAVARLLRANRRTKDIGLIAVTGDDLLGREAIGLQKACDGFVRKPLEPASLQAELERVLRRCSGCIEEEEKEKKTVAGEERNLG